MILRVMAFITILLASSACTTIEEIEPPPIEDQPSALVDPREVERQVDNAAEETDQQISDTSEKAIADREQDPRNTEPDASTNNQPEIDPLRYSLPTKKPKNHASSEQQTSQSSTEQYQSAKKNTISSELSKTEKTETNSEVGSTTSTKSLASEERIDLEQNVGEKSVPQSTSDNKEQKQDKSPGGASPTEKTEKNEAAEKGRALTKKDTPGSNNAENEGNSFTKVDENDRHRQGISAGNGESDRSSNGSVIISGQKSSIKWNIQRRVNTESSPQD